MLFYVILVSRKGADQPPSSGKGSSGADGSKKGTSEKEGSDKSSSKKEGSGSDKNIWLYNLSEDPQEKTDLSESKPDVVKQLLQRLAYYNSTAVQPLQLPWDDNYLPTSTGDAWVPWTQLESMPTPCTGACDAAGATLLINKMLITLASILVTYTL